MIDLRQTIATKSDQLNADDLIAGPMTIRVTRVSLCAEPDQPIAISFEGDNGKPYKPCKSMRRLLVSVWGPDGSAYAGRSMTLYRDEKVKFGGAEVGGIRISHMSDIDKPVTVALTVTKSVRRPFQVKPLRDEPTPPAPAAIADVVAISDVLSRIAAAADQSQLDALKPLIRQLTNPDERQRAIDAGVARRAALESNTNTEAA